IWVSYFGGGKIPFARDFQTGECVTYLEVAEDRETLLAWRKAGFPQNRLIPLDAEHNFWMEKPKKKNTSLKCGPTSELFYDLGKDKACGKNCIPGCRCGRFIEFSNNRFITHRLNPRKGNLEKVKNALAETVIGIERISMITGNVPSIWDTPSCQPVMRKIYEFVTCENEDEVFIRESESVIADHLKALCVLIADGAPAPGRSGRARIVRTLIRKILTRMMLLGIDAEKFFPVIISAVMPEAANQKSLKEKMTAYLENESEVFRNTLKKESNELEKMISGNQGKSLSASQTFFLKEYRGMPVLLTKKCRVT
ncbi:MAG: alanine--tRNA ligase-related protein, partial [Desulfococcaceae bacterium]|nr:alanine--tRNA ligase-related protein [Desulfococcaceae bacterium]